MQIDTQELAATYGRCSDDELAALAAEMETLTDTARSALQAEIRNRGTTNGQLLKLHSKEVHREGRFDQLESVRRKRTLLYLLTKNDPKGTIAVVLAVLGLALFVLLRSLFH
ncbi:MAG TPA: hypothetical protein VGJ21_07465 [Terracidiphilus sp.]